jgi:hypothetical protein
MEDDGRFRRLRKWNTIAFVLHAVSGTLMLALSTDFALPVTTAFVQYDPATNQLAPTLATAFTLQIGPLVAAFLFLSALAHLMISLPAPFRWYVAGLKRGINEARWIEYALSSSLMIVVVSMLVGLTDAAALLLIFFLNMMMILFGWMMELHNQTTERTKWTAYWFGVLAGAVPWVAIAIYLFGAGGEGGEVPSFVYWIYFSIFLFFNVFAVNMILQYKKAGKWREYLYGEKTYIILSFVAKSLLAWQVWAGTLRPI